MNLTRPIRAAALACALAMLAGCAQGNSELSAAPQPAAAPAPAAQAAPPPPPQGPMTAEKAKADCWMKYEGDKKVKNIDQRLTLVEKCVDETMRNQPPARASR